MGIVDSTALAELIREELGGAVARERLDHLTHKIAQLEAEWEEMPVPPDQMGYTASSLCSDICILAERIMAGDKIRVYRKKQV